VPNRNQTTYLLAILGGLALRLLFVVNFPVVQGDSLIYANIARNWLHQGVFGVGDGAAVSPTLIRLPGYPAFLAVVFAVFGDNSFRIVMLLQVLIDLASCWAIAELAAEMVPEDIRQRAHQWAFILAALCLFTANYAALPLTETLSIATTAWALLMAVRFVNSSEKSGRRRLYNVGCGILCAAGSFLRPDNGIVVAVICGALLVAGRVRRPAYKCEPLVSAVQEQSVTNRSKAPALSGLRAAMTVGVIAILPLIPWTIRNWKTFHVIQPLAPRYANDPEEFVPRGFNRWVKTWIVDYASTEEVYWRIDDSEHPADPDDLPSRAFDSPAQRDATYQLFYDIPSDGALTPETDARFAELAQARVRGHWLRYYVALPLARITNMWLRPRIEMLPFEQRWWEFEDTRESWIAIGMAAINLALIVLALIGAFRFRSPAGWMLVTFVVVRSLFLGTLENPETRYTLECFPVVLAMAGAAVAWITKRKDAEPQRTIG
jgi:hypothetical protein